MYGRIALDPGRAARASGTTCCSGRRRRRAPAGATPSARSRARSWTGSTATGRAPAAAGALRPRVRAPRGCPRTSRRRRSRPANGTVHLPALIAEVFGGSRSDARRTLAQGGVKLDGEPLAGDALDVAGGPARRRACCRWASGASRACAGRAALTGDRRPVAAGGRAACYSSAPQRWMTAPSVGPESSGPAPKALSSTARSERSVGPAPTSAKSRESPSQGAPVFENSTACTHGPLPGG